MNTFPSSASLSVSSQSKKEHADNSSSSVKRREFKQYVSSLIVKRLSYYLQKKEIESKVNTLFKGYNTKGIF